MKGFLFLATSLTVSIAYGQVVRDAVKPNPVLVSTRLQLMVTVEQPSVKTGEPVTVHASLKNVFSESIALADRGWMPDYALMVTDASGTEPPRTALGETWLQQQRAPSFLWRTRGPLMLEPGATAEEFVINVAKYYQLTRPGTYFVRLMYRSVLPDFSEPRPTTVEEAQKIPLEEAVSELIPFTITP